MSDDLASRRPRSKEPKKRHSSSKTPKILCHRHQIFSFAEEIAVEQQVDGCDNTSVSSSKPSNAAQKVLPGEFARP